MVLLVLWLLVDVVFPSAIFPWPSKSSLLDEPAAAAASSATGLRRGEDDVAEEH